MIELVKKVEEDRKEIEKRVKDESQKQVIILSFVQNSVSKFIYKWTFDGLSCFLVLFAIIKAKRKIFSKQNKRAYNFVF